MTGEHAQEQYVTREFLEMQQRIHIDPLKMSVARIERQLPKLQQSIHEAALGEADTDKTFGEINRRLGAIESTYNKALWFFIAQLLATIGFLIQQLISK